jgi:hypothetical protein
MMCCFKEQGNVSALVQIFNAIPSPPWRGDLLPPSNDRFALCLPFSGFALRPRGHTPLEPPTAFLPMLLSFSAPAELRMINPTVGPNIMLILTSYLFTYRAQYILCVRQSRIPSKEGSGRLGRLGRNLPCRFDTSLYPYLRLNSRHFETKPKFKGRYYSKK